MAQGQPLRRGRGQRFTRIPPGHPEGYLEAFANVYREAFVAIAAEVKGQKVPKNLDFPTIEDGVEGMAFIRGRRQEQPPRREVGEAAPLRGSRGTLTPGREQDAPVQGKAAPMKRHPVAKAGEIRPGRGRSSAWARVEIGVFNVGGEIRAYRNACPHAGAPVCTGGVSGTSLPSTVYEYLYGREGSILRCPWHGWEFDLRTGEHVVDPRVRLKMLPVEPAKREDLDAIPLEQSDGTLYVLLPDQ